MSKMDKTLSDETEVLMDFNAMARIDDFDEKMDEGFGKFYPEVPLKHHIKLAQQDLEKEFDKWWSTPATTYRFEDKIFEVFLKYFGAKLLSTDKERSAK